MLSEKEGQFETDYETFQWNIQKFKKSGKKNYDFLTKSGPKFQKAVFKMCQRMIREESFPTSFQKTTLHMIYKGKGKKDSLPDHRFVHCKSWWPRVAESLVVEGGLKELLLRGSSMYQIGGQPGHRPEEHMFVLKSSLARLRAQGKMAIVQCYDVSKYFDKEMIQDAVLTCLKRGADKKAIRLWYKLNDQTRIQVRTGAGMSRFGNVGAVVGQGMLGGALASQAVLDEGVTEHVTPAGRLQMNYGEVPMAPLLWIDDIINTAGGLDEARQINVLVNKVMKQRGLSLNEDKSAIIIMGSKKQKLQASTELEKDPLLCGHFVTKEKQNDKWLGQILSSGGLASCVEETVNAKLGKIRGASLEIALVVNDWRARQIGGMETALLLWESCCIPSLLHGAGTWVKISRATEKQLNKLQGWYIRLILQIGPGSPIAAMMWDFSLLDMSIRVWREKLMMIIHIRDLDQDSLANRVYEEQKAKQWPGLAQETKIICEQLGIEDCNTTALAKADYRKIVTAACHRKNEEFIR